MRVKILVSLLLMAALSACSSLNQTSTQDKGEVQFNKREITEEEQTYIDILLAGEYDSLIELTGNRDSELKEDFYHLASVLQQYDEAEKRKKDPSVMYEELELRYSIILRQLKKVNHIPAELEEKVKEVKKLSQYQKDYYANKQL